MGEVNGNVKVFMFTGAIGGGVLGMVALIHTLVYMPLKSDTMALSEKVDKRYDEQIKSTMDIVAALARIETRLGIELIKK